MDHQLLVMKGIQTFPPMLHIHKGEMMLLNYTGLVEGENLVCCVTCHLHGCWRFLVKSNMYVSVCEPRTFLSYFK